MDNIARWETYTEQVVTITPKGSYGSWVGSAGDL